MIIAKQAGGLENIREALIKTCLCNLVWMLLLSILLAPQDSWAARIDASSCSPVGFVTADNDIRLDNDNRSPGKRIPLPTAVSNKVRAILVHILAGAPELGDGLTCDMLGEAVYRVSGVGQPDLYVANLAVPTGPSFFFLILYEPRSGRVTQDPPRIGSKWPGLFGAQDSLVRTPFVSSTNLLKDGHRQIVFEERVHNGTVYNAVVYHYFDLLPRLKLRRVFAIENRLIDPEKDNVEYMREIRPISSNALKLDMYEVEIEGGARKRHLGYTLLEREGPGQVFHVSKRHPFPGMTAGELVTDCESAISDDVFLRDGCDFYY